MTRKEFLDRRYDLSVTAGMNQRYHHKMAARWECLNRFAMIGTALFAIAGACLSIATIWNSNAVLVGFSVFVSVTAALFAFVLNVYPYATWELRHVDLFRRWTDLREEVDAIELRIEDGVVEPWMLERIIEIGAKLQRINGAEPLEDRFMLLQCQREEERSRGCDVQIPKSNETRWGLIWRAIKMPFKAEYPPSPAGTP